MSQFDVDTTEGFTRALAEQAGGSVPDDQEFGEDRSVARGLTQESSQESVDTGNSESGAAPASTEEQPNELEAAQQMIGRQSNEIGELRQALEQQQQQLEEFMQFADEEPEAPLDNSQFGHLDQIAEDRGGKEAVAAAVQLGENLPDEQEIALVDHAVQRWLEENDPEAIQYSQRWELEKFRAEQDAPTQIDPELQQIVDQRRMDQAFNTLVSGLGEEAQALAPHIAPAIEETGELHQTIIADALASGDPKLTEAAFTEVINLARKRAEISSTDVGRQQRQVGQVAAKQAAQVATGSTHISNAGQSGNLPTTKEEYDARVEGLSTPERAKLAGLIMAKEWEETETTSVAEGLKQGRQ